jgi:sister chromatid cohesion protein PDS5
VEPSDETQKNFGGSFRKMSTSFADTVRAEECFETLHRMKDNNIFKDLVELINGGTTYATCCMTRVILFSTDNTGDGLISPYFCSLYV